MIHWCIFCLRRLPFIKIEIDPDHPNQQRSSGDRELILEFLKFSQRLRSSTSKNNETYAQNEIVDSLAICEECKKLVQEFCDIYKEVRSLELKLNWKLETVQNVMTSAAEVTTELEDEFGRENVDKLKKFEEFRNGIVRETSQKLKSALPRIQLKKWEITTTTGFEDGFPPSAAPAPDSPEEDDDPLQSDTDSMFNSGFESPVEEYIPSEPHGVANSKIVTRSKETRSKSSPLAEKLKSKSLGNQRDIKRPKAEDEDAGESKSEGAPELKTKTCSDCNKTFTSRLRYHHHRRTKHYSLETFKFVCAFEECGRRFEADSDRKNHETQHKQGMETCPVCSKLVTCISNHMRSHQKHQTWISDLVLSPEFAGLIGARVCPVSKCMKEFYNERDLNIHSKLHGMFKCNSCDVSVNYAEDLAIHETTNHLDQKHGSVCPRCEFTVTTGDMKECLIIAHFIETHLELEMDFHSCPICLTKFKGKPGPQTRTNLHGHFKRLHHYTGEESIFRCDEPGCKAYFNTRIQLTVHRNNHRASVYVDGNGFECNACGKAFTTKGILLRHIKQLHPKTPSGEHPYPCPVIKCEQRFKTEEELEQHTKKEDVVTCSQCSKSFHGQQALTNHTKFCGNDRNKKEWFCELCGKSFEYESWLGQHKAKAHTGPESWQFACEVCGKKFFFKAKLEEHIRTHTKEKILSCELCGIGFAYTCTLRRHMIRKHSESKVSADGTSEKIKSGNMKAKKKKSQKRKSDSDSESDYFDLPVLKPKRGKQKKATPQDFLPT